METCCVTILRPNMANKKENYAQDKKKPLRHIDTAIA